MQQISSNVSVGSGRAKSSQRSRRIIDKQGSSNDLLSLGIIHSPGLQLKKQSTSSAHGL